MDPITSKISKDKRNSILITILFLSLCYNKSIIFQFVHISNSVCHYNYFSVCVAEQNTMVFGDAYTTYLLF